MISSTSGSVFTLSPSSLAIWLSLTKTVRVEFSICMKNLFKPFLMMKVAGTGLVSSLAFERMDSTHRNLLMLVVSLCFPKEAQLEFFPSSSLKRCDVSSVLFARMPQWHIKIRNPRLKCPHHCMNCSFN